jgi:hypothetical protein
MDKEENAMKKWKVGLGFWRVWSWGFSPGLGNGR